MFAFGSSKSEYAQCKCEGPHCVQDYHMYTKTITLVDSDLWASVHAWDGGNASLQKPMNSNK